MGFNSPTSLLLLIGLPAFGWLFVIAWGHFRRFENSAPFRTFAGNNPTWMARLSAGLLKLAALALVILGLANPFINLPVSEPKYKNVRLFFLLDVSGSMVYAEDVKPNRLAAVKEELLRFYDGLDGSYEISLIPFAGSPNPYYCPLTYSRAAVRPLIEKVGPESAPTLGTDLTAVFSILEPGKEGINLVVLLTDGGKEESEATDRTKLMQTIEEFTNTKVYAVGVGGSEPAALIRRDRDGAFVEYVQDGQQPATSQIDEEILKQIAARGHGEYLHFSEPGQLSPFLEGAMKASRVPEDNVVTRKTEVRCYFFAAGAVVFWLTFFFNKGWCKAKARV